MSKGIRKQYDGAFKLKVVLETYKNEKTLAQIASEYQVHATQIHLWKNQFKEQVPAIFQKAKDQEKSELKVLVDQFLVKLHEHALETGHLLHMFLKAFVHGAQRKITKWAIIDFYDDTCSKLERDFFIFRNRFWPPPASQPSLFFNPSEKW